MPDRPSAPHPSRSSQRSQDSQQKRKPKARNARHALGAAGEERAARFLARRGYRIAERNVRVGGVEVDLIAIRGGLVAFVEVKTRSSAIHGRPELAVDAAKQARLVRAASAWLRERRMTVRRVRFDVVACRAPANGQGRWEIEHLEAAFDANDG